MSEHAARIKEGSAAAIVLLVFGIILLILKLLWQHVIFPYSSVILGGITVTIGIIVALYVLGYIVRDLPDDVRGWIGDE